MLRLLAFLWSGCFHKWSVHFEGRIVDNKGDGIGRFYHLRCEKCGAITSKRFQP